MLAKNIRGCCISTLAVGTHRVPTLCACLLPAARPVPPLLLCPLDGQTIRRVLRREKRCLRDAAQQALLRTRHFILSLLNMRFNAASGDGDAAALPSRRTSARGRACEKHQWRACIAPQQTGRRRRRWVIRSTFSRKEHRFRGWLLCLLTLGGQANRTTDGKSGRYYRYWRSSAAISRPPPQHLAAALTLCRLSFRRTTWRRSNARLPRRIMVAAVAVAAAAAARAARRGDGAAPNAYNAAAANGAATWLTAACCAAANLPSPSSGSLRDDRVAFHTFLAARGRGARASPAVYYLSPACLARPLLWRAYAGGARLPAARVSSALCHISCACFFSTSC